jgi:hypothetical protein
MAEQKKREKKTSNGTARGARKTHLSRLQLALMGKGPTEQAARVMYRKSLKNPSARPAKAHK